MITNKRKFKRVEVDVGNGLYKTAYVCPDEVVAVSPVRSENCCCIVVKDMDYIMTVRGCVEDVMLELFKDEEVENA